ncbi:MAG: FAD-binding oxidoreductase [bacterium]|nr:FAD-binding oxidoreductase [bacterium]
MSHRATQIVVIGAGIVGSSVAYHLARRGARVTMLDTDEPGQGATPVSFAWMNGRDKNPRHYHDLNRRSLDQWTRFAQVVGAPAALTWGGELRWAVSEEDAEEMVQRIRTLQSWGYPIFLLDGDDVAQMEPRLKPGRVLAASFSESDGHVDTGAFVHALKQMLETCGATRLSTRVTGFSLRNHKVHAVLTSEGEIACDAVVLAAGADTAAVAHMAHVHIPMYDTFGCTVITEPVPPLFNRVCVVHSPQDTFPQTNFRQLPNGTVMMHGGAHGRVFDGSSMGQNNEEIRVLQNSVAQVMPALEGVPIREIRRGRRPIPKDGHPILGFARQVPNLYLTVMHSGVTLAPLVGESATIEILEQTHIDYLEPYRLSRFD